MHPESHRHAAPPLSSLLSSPMIPGYGRSTYPVQSPYLRRKWQSCADGMELCRPIL